ncbi:MAG: protein translocase SEC61 complex subunit gamma [Candidatus Iainarchaeum archaeon]|uniref:Protein translocase subunit SecE n=1 Tax=Candidatus Iainarchaeum sp. TaxID=3101447 RepID=A0A497JID4_9ARCH|nr:MAG: protein translocase SEC61 complex subunit gamma [Candidatus Diapherotrites archaeon]
MLNIQEFLNNVKRIFIISKKPTKEEFIMMAKITGLGIVLIGVIGFIIRLIFQFIG